MFLYSLSASHTLSKTVLCQLIKRDHDIGDHFMSRVSEMWNEMRMSNNADCRVRVIIIIFCLILITFFPNNVFYATDHRISL